MPQVPKTLSDIYVDIYVSENPSSNSGVANKCFQGVNNAKVTNIRAKGIEVSWVNCQ
jgi:hypothetical protein